jgi:DNA-binding LacI/PurR family transcriptional regulator
MLAGQMTKHRPATMSQLAKLAGVSVSTVSRSLAGSDLIQKATRDRITELAREHDFQPNIVARNLRLRRTETIGVVVPLGHQADQHLTDPFFLTMIGNLADELAARGFDMLLKKIVPTDGDWLRKFADSGRVDGIVVIGQSNQLAAIERLASRYAPLVLWGAEVPGQSCVTVGSDNLTGGYMAARHLIDQGRRNLVFLGDASVPEIALREEGFQRACDEAGPEASAHSVRVGLVADQAYTDLLRIIDQERDIDGIVAASDVIAISTIRALEALGIKVPDDVAVVGYDDVPIARHVAPALTTIRQDMGRGAGLLIEKLFAILAGNEQRSEFMPPELVVRQSG